jgi:secreted trypsin-like serine protease
VASDQTGAEEAYRGLPRALATLACSLIFCTHAALTCSPASAMVGGATNANEAVARHVVMLVGPRGFCSGVAIARNVVLTAAHCVLPGADTKLAEFDAARQPVLKDVATVARHPGFDADAALRQRVTADVALLTLAEPLAARFVPAPLAAPRRPVAVGDLLLVAGYGLAARGDGRSGGTLRAARLAVTGQPGTLQIRLVDPATKGDRPGLGACTGDSGAPVLEDAGGQLGVLGVVSWSTGPALSEGCGGLTGVTPLARYRDWIVTTAGKLAR